MSVWLSRTNAVGRNLFDALSAKAVATSNSRNAGVLSTDLPIRAKKKFSKYSLLVLVLFVWLHIFCVHQIFQSLHTMR
jgi:predicted membrane channel-forming protein YqfA (hemolysin III family)